jgi:hypothetical protein
LRELDDTFTLRDLRWLYIRAKLRAKRLHLRIVKENVWCDDWGRGGTDVEGLWPRLIFENEKAAALVAVMRQLR